MLFVLHQAHYLLTNYCQQSFLTLHTSITFNMNNVKPILTGRKDHVLQTAKAHSELEP